MGCRGLFAPTRQNGNGDQRQSSVIRTMLYGAFVAAFAVRVVLPVLGDNYDMQSWRGVADLVQAGRNVYASTPRYNYGPIWFLILGALADLQARFGPAGALQGLHVWVAALLALVDMSAALLLMRRWGTGAGVALLLCPISIWISGFHSQFDNLAVVTAFVSWLLICDGGERPGRSRWWGAAALLGLSLATKHLMLFFPLWMLFWPARPLRDRIAFGAVAYAVCALTFVPFALDPASRSGIYRWVISYSSGFGSALMPKLLDATVTGGRLHAGTHFSLTLYKCVWVALLTVVGAVLARRTRADLFLCYLVAFVLFSSAMADQYLAIPLVATCVLWRRPAAWAYWAAGTLVLMASPNETGCIAALLQLQRALHHFGLEPAAGQMFLLPILLAAVRCTASPAAAGASPAVAPVEPFGSAAGQVIAPAGLPEQP